jgi:hypothetical protein
VTGALIVSRVSFKKIGTFETINVRYRKEAKSKTLRRKPASKRYIDLLFKKDLFFVKKFNEKA